MFKRMAEFGPDSGGRVKGVTIVKPIVYGNVARYFGKKREEDGHTHQWTVYVKPYRNEDMSAYVKKIQFKLHESYGNPLRVVTKPPYEITETGWGEFEIIIKIFFIDPNERPVTLYHLLKLFQSDTNAMLGKKTVVSEFYDEMIFQDPTAMMQQLLTTSRQLTLGAYKHETECGRDPGVCFIICWVTGCTLEEERGLELGILKWDVDATASPVFHNACLRTHSVMLFLVLPLTSCALFMMRYFLPR
ncbi:YEATS domain-containing protein 4 isoform X1 [Lepus europaeus]|uniref:YEATS domain-containing protein 4 isoform X1 n=1 Tax=Lepus europaeus TaxID=9983 RepID=UPI002B464F9A|nr:YEATS domain-containing protein 4 isoform X1 [Lepus europaeus]